MHDKITKHIVSYPKGEEPDYLIPNEYCDYRYAIGKKGSDPLVIICMNPSAARDETSDMTINRIISISKKLRKDGWFVFNTYPQRATNANNISEYTENLSKENINVIIDFLLENKITEVYGAWGNATNPALIKGQLELKEKLKLHNVKVYYFGTLTKAGNPRHPLQRHEKTCFIESNKKYL